MTADCLWEVAIATPLRRRFVYRIPNELGEPIPGKRVLVPFGPRRVTGYLVEPCTTKPSGSFTIKNAVAMPDHESPFRDELFRFLLEASSYYLHSLGEVIKTALPPGMNEVDQKDGKKTRLKPKAYQIVHLSQELTSQSIKETLSELESRAPARFRFLNDIIKLEKALLADLRKEHPRATDLVKRLADDGLVIIKEQSWKPDPFDGSRVEKDETPTLNSEQIDAVDAIERRLEKGGYQGFLLHGITGSGKTEVYLRAIEKAREQNKGALVLVPEISLTPQLVHRYRARFGDELAVLHSGLSDRARFERWQSLRSGRIKVAIGVRSAIFAPLARLGIIIVDEEHDSSFKQDRGFAYNGRDLALLRAARAGAVAVLGSATPSLESHNNAETKKLTRLTLEKRATGQSLPEVSVIDLKRHHSGPGGQSLVTAPLFEAISKTLERKEQAILFLNRRGFAPAMVCGNCGETINCKACSVALTFHARPAGLVCHYCGAKRAIAKLCPNCSTGELKPVGSGTQKAEDTLQDLFPAAQIARMDRDSASGRKGEIILEQLRAREIDILVGTQMVTKGHDFPFVTLVGVLNADVGLHMPDFRAAERTFQLLTQVAGRAGRSALGGRAFIQTYSAQHPAITTARTHDYKTFVEAESNNREELGYPPFGRTAAIRISSPKEHTVESAARSLFTTLKNIYIRQGSPDIAFLGPAPAPLSQVKGRFRWHILLKSQRQDLIRGLLEQALPSIETPPSGVRIRIDIDPQSML